MYIGYQTITLFVSLNIFNVSQEMWISERYCRQLIQRVREKYAIERLYLLRCLKHLLSFFQEDQHPYKVMFSYLFVVSETALRYLLYKAVWEKCRLFLLKFIFS